MATTKEREAQRRAERVENFERQINDGSLVIRQMTAEERARYARPAKAKAKAERPGRKRR
jgi:hypothetical protein